MSSGVVPIRGRSGKPFTIYLTTVQFERLEKLAKDRHIAKSTLLRIALDRLIDQLDSGQLELPLGVEE